MFIAFVVNDFSNTVPRENLIKLITPRLCTYVLLTFWMYFIRIFDGRFLRPTFTASSSLSKTSSLSNFYGFVILIQDYCGQRLRLRHPYPRWLLNHLNVFIPLTTPEELFFSSNKQRKMIEGESYFQNGSEDGN